MDKSAQGFEGLSPTKQALLLQKLQRQRSRRVLERIVQRERRAEIVPLSFAQQQIWFLTQLAQDTTVYTLPTAFVLTGHLTISILERSLTEIVRRHEILRTRFAESQGQPVQIIDAPYPLAAALVELAQLTEQEQEEEIARLIHEEVSTPFDLARGPLLRVRLLRMGRERHILMICMHHIIADGWSHGLFFHELEVLYTAFCADLPSPLAEPTLQYADYACWQREQMHSAAHEEDLSYWRQRLSDLPQLALATDYLRQEVRHFRGATRRFTLSETLSEALRRRSQSAGVTLFMTVLAAFQLVLLRYSGQRDMGIGTPVAQRTREELGGLMGLVVNTLVLRGTLAGNPSLHELLHRVRRTTLEAYEHLELPFERLVEALNPERSLGSNPLFQVMIAWQHTARSTLTLAGLEVQALSIELNTSPFDLTLNLSEEGQRLVGAVVYDCDLFEADTIERFIEYYHQMLERIATQPEQRLEDVALLTPYEQQLVNTWNDTRRALPDKVCMHQRFEEQVLRRPDAIAVTYEEQHLTYAELNARANQVAHYLRTLGGEGEAHIGICVERSLLMLIGLLGILKAGAAYVPLDPDYPKEHLNFLLTDAQVPLLLTQQRLLADLPLVDGTRPVCLDSDWVEQIGGCPTDNLESPVSGGNLCYVIYTSGSTGRPKGVQVLHKAVVNLLAAMQQCLHLRPKDRFLAVTTLSFDIAALELFLPLVTGACSIVLGREIASDGKGLATALALRGATCMQATPVTWRLLLAAGWQGDTQLRILCGGEALPRNLAEHLLAKGRDVWNVYGPTETTIWSAAHLVTRGQSAVPIGRPLDNTTIYLLDDVLCQVPIGVPGELYIGGIGVARGYLNRTELTAERFLPDPFFQQSGTRMYRTGDRARYRSDGTIEYLGRIDHQVKLHGHRIEPGEIEVLLNQHPAIREAVVALHEDSADEKRLIAYIVPRAERALELGELLAFLRSRLPSYMIPSVFTTLERLPLTPNGKVDRRMLPAPDSTRMRARETYGEPRTALERLLVGVWQEVLRLERVGIHDNFFEAGGDSISSLQVVARARQLGIQFTPRQIFQQQSVAELATVAAYTSNEPTAREGASVPDADHLVVQGAADRHSEESYPLSPLQEGLLFHTLSAPRSQVYHNQLALTLYGVVNVVMLKQAWHMVIERHDVLRTTIIWQQEGEPAQLVQRHAEVPWEVQDWRMLSPMEQEQHLAVLMRQDREQAFELTQAPLLRLILVRRDQEQAYLLWSYHHILLDGWSIALLLTEVFTCYEALCEGKRPSLPPAHSYREYLVWLQQQDLGQAETYWRHILASFTTPTQLMRAEQTGGGPGHAEERLLVSATTTNALQAYARQHRLTLNTLMQGAWALLLSRYSGEQDVLFGVTTSGRPATLPGAERMVGLFINTLPLRVSVPEEMLLSSWLKEVQECHLALMQYEYSPLVNVQQWSQVLRGTALFESVLVFENYPIDSALQRSGSMLQIRHARVVEPTNYALTLAVRQGREIALNLSYQTERFEAAPMQRLLGQLHTVLQAMVAHQEQRLAELLFISQTDDRHRVPDGKVRRAEYPRNMCLHECFEAQVERRPDAVAVVLSPYHVTYRELNERANQVAHALQQLNIGPESRVGLYMERSVELLVGLLGTLKAGAAYVPLDADYPAERLSFILQDAQIALLLTQSHLQRHLPARGPFALYLDAEPMEHWKRSNPGTRMDPRNLAYVIYTSGSTGQPKGTLIAHQAVVNHSTAMARSYELRPSDRVHQFASISFDVAVEELFPSWLAGAAVILQPHALLLPPADVLKQVEREQLTVLNLPAAYWHDWVAELAASPPPATLRLVVIGSDAVLSEKLASWYNSVGDAVRWLNAYGSTEATITSTVYEPNDEGRPLHGQVVPIGHPISNVEVYVVHADYRIAPPGATGELYIGGDGLARGYLNRPELTAERFVPDPFSGHEGARLYRTGDLVQRRADGTLEFVGRVDQQVKLRGFRIEPGEIEACLRGHPLIREAIVLMREDVPGERYLAAYLLPAQQAQLSLTELRRYLKERLPSSMLPAAYVHLEHLPLGTSGKVERRALPAPRQQDRLAAESLYVAPQTEMERLISGIWQQVLRIPKVGIHDNFFDLGGHSLLLTRVYSQLRAVLEQELSMIELFQHPTVFALAAYLSQGNQAAPSLQAEPGRAERRQLLTRRQRELRQQRGASEQYKGGKDE